MGALLARIRGFFAPRYIATRCGHKTKLIGKVESSFGGSGSGSEVIGMPVKADGTVDYCLDCLAKMTIRCAWCGKPIFIGSTVTSYLPKDGVTMPDYAVARDGSPAKGYIGCCRCWCVEDLDDLIGRWLPGIHGAGRVALFREPSNWPGH